MASPRVLMIHSGGFTSRQWRRLGERLAPRFDVIAPDLLGYAANGPWPDGAPFHFDEDVAHLARALGDAPAHVVGHSYGGFLALKLPLARPAQVTSLALYEPVAFGILDEDVEPDRAARAELARLPLVYDGEPWLAAFVAWWNGPGAWDAMGADARAGFRAVGPKVFQEVASLMADRTDRAGYGAITAPALLLGGETSPFAEKRTLEKLAAALPHARRETIAGAGHMGPITHGAVVNDAIAGFLAQAP